MSDSIDSIIPEAEVLLSLEPEELAGIVLQHLNSLPEHDRNSLSKHNFSLPNGSVVNVYPPEHRDDIARALMEAWSWLEREGLLAPKPGDVNWSFITRRGRRLATAGDMEAYRKANMLPQRLLHPIIAQKVWATFLRGDYDTAVFQSFKEVEVRVREVAGLTADDIGVKLMRQAFEPENGPLTDRSVPKSEREALCHLFAGAIGSYKNPHSHRSVTIESSEAVEMIMLASHLLAIVDARSSTVG